MKKDKALHLTIAFLITYIGLGILYFLFNLWRSPDLAYLIANIIMLILIVGKECWDCVKENPTGFSLPDIAFGITGMIMADIIFYISIFVYWNLK